jgi:zinc protease
LKTSIVSLLVIFIMMILLSCNFPGRSPELSNQTKGDSLWPHDGSDLLSDDRTVFGRLDNGLRYVIRENQTPRDRVSMHLYVQAGSLYERHEEQGIAHFLEHMLFNGSKHFPPGEMVKYFQRIGMQFGPDANAHTGFDKTVYDVLLPKGDPKSLSEGLLVLRDYADGALLLPEEVEREKKVVLAEMRSRDSADFRTLKATFQFEMPGLIVAERFPIGEAEIIKQMDAQLLRDFYEAWYRPERMFLVIVGDLEKETAERIIAKQFDDFKPLQPPRQAPAFGRMAHTGVKVFHHYEKDSGATSVGIETIMQQDRPRDSKAYQRNQMVEDIAQTMMQKRLDDIVRGPETVLTSAGIGAGHYLRRIKYAEISGRVDPTNWRAAVTEIEQALRKAVVHGFTPAEVNRAKNEYQARLIQSREEDGTRDSKTLAREIMDSIRDWQVLQSPRQRVELLLNEVDTVTPAQTNQAFKDMWSVDHRLVLVTGNADLTSTPSLPEKKIEAVYLSSAKVGVAPLAEKNIGAFPYLSIPQFSGGVEKREEIKDLGITKVLFKNGVSLFLKRTRFKENEVLAALSFGSGKSSEPLDRPGLAMMTEDVVNESGFGAMDRIALEDALAGRLASIDFEVREDRFVIKGQAIKKELPLLFQLLQAAVEDPGYSEESRQLAIKRYTQEHLRMSRSVDGVMRLKGQRFLAGGDNRFGVPALEDLRQRSLDQVKEWMGQQLNKSPMELAIVGDFDVDRAVELAERYIGSLPRKEGAYSVLPVSGPQFPAGKALKLSIRTETPKALVVVAYPTEDFWDIQRTRRLSIMSELYSERLRQHIREKLGAAYSPYAYNRSSRAYKGYGMTQIFIQVDPKQSDKIVEEVRQISAQLRAKSADTDEFKRILDPTLTHIKDLRQKNVYWLDSVLTGAARHPEQLDWARTFESDYAAIRKEEISALARKYLVADHAATIVLTPGAVSP